MTIQDKMFEQIEKEIDQTIAEEKGKVSVDQNKAKKVAKMLTELSTDPKEADVLTNQYIAQIKIICNE